MMARVCWRLTFVCHLLTEGQGCTCLRRAHDLDLQSKRRSPPPKLEQEQGGAHTCLSQLGPPAWLLHTAPCIHTAHNRPAGLGRGHQHADLPKSNGKYTPAAASCTGMNAGRPPTSPTAVQSHPGKRARLRDMGLWAVDPPEFYQGSFVTVELFGVPEASGVKPAGWPHGAIVGRSIRLNSSKTVLWNRLV